MTGISARNVTARYNGSPILRGVDLDVRRGEWLVVIGPNGAGKTTLVRALSGSLATGGEVLLGGRHLADMRRRDVAAQIAVVP